MVWSDEDYLFKDFIDREKNRSLLELSLFYLVETFYLKGKRASLGTHISTGLLLSVGDLVIENVNRDGANLLYDNKKIIAGVKGFNVAAFTIYNFVPRNLWTLIYFLSVHTLAKYNMTYWLDQGSEKDPEKWGGWLGLNMRKYRKYLGLPEKLPWDLDY